MTNEQLKQQGIETACVQGGYQADNHAPRVMPIVQSTTYRYASADDLGDAFDLKTPSPIYTRLGNPTLSWVEEKVALLEGGIAALSTASGQAATFFALVNLAENGDHILAAQNLYGGTHTLFSSQLKRLGINIEFIDLNDPFDVLIEKVRPETRAIFAESLSNPSMEVLDFKKARALADAANAPLVVDNTFPSPYLCQPIKHGAHIVIHSASKYLDGHAIALGGFIVDSGTFSFAGEKWERFNTPDADYHGLVYTEVFKEAAYIARARASLLRDFGATMSPQNAFLINLGIETLHLRMQRHSENALKVAEYLAAHKKVAWVRYPHLLGDPSYEKAQTYLPKGASGVVSFGVHGGSKQAKRLCDAVKLATLVTHVGDLRTHLLHPASTTHRQLSDDALKKAGVAPELIRLNVGIESIDDIIKDLEQALASLSS